MADDVVRRAVSVRLAREVLFGLEHDTADLLIVADWLLTGRASLAMELADQTARNFSSSPVRISPDAATWSQAGELTDG